MLAFQASGTGSIPVRCNVFFLRSHAFCCVAARKCYGYVIVTFLTPSLSMKQPLSKRRRVSSNPLTPLSSSDVLVASLKFSTCTSCHRTIGLKSSPAFPCTRSVEFSETSINVSQCSENTADAAHHRAPSACGHALVILYLVLTWLVLSIRHPIWPPLRFLKVTQIPHRHVEDVPVMKIQIMSRRRRI